MPRRNRQDQCWGGIDNGVTGSIGLIFSNGTKLFFKVPTIKEQNYTKTKKRLSRINFPELLAILEPYKEQIQMCLLERPMVNPTRFQASCSALRALEATLIVLETLEIPLAYVDSKEWQTALLPKGIKGSKDLKVASKEIASRLFPHNKEAIIKHKDGDGILIAEFCRRSYS